jgi:hypothetical protein
MVGHRPLCEAYFERCGRIERTRCVRVIGEDDDFFCQMLVTPTMLRCPLTN